jgi:two-component system, NarL family, response regulator DevR
MTMTEQRQITVLLVEDHEVTRVGLRSLLSNFEQLKVVGEADDVAGAVARAAELKPDVVLLDIRLRNESGFDACREMQRLGLETGVLFLTSYADDEILFEALACGAKGYLLKEINSGSLVNAIENVAAGRSILDPAVTDRVLARLKDAPAPVGNDERLARLSPQEARVVALVAEGKTNREIGAAMGLSEKTVKNYLSNAMEKLHATRRAQVAALFAHEQRRTGH